MSTSEILQELPKLERSERAKVWERLEELELAEIVETPEMLAAIDAARLSVKAGKTYTAEQAHEFVAQWTTKSS